MNYKKLHAGDTREEGDQVCRKVNVDFDTISLSGPEERLYATSFIWQPVRLLGHVILASDLIVSSFRRPCGP